MSREAPSRRAFWIGAAAICLVFLAGYGALKVRQVSAAFDGWEGQDIGPAPGAAK